MGFKWLFKTFFYVGIFSVCIIFGCIFYLWYSYIDETIVSGSAYGFTIGDSKLETYEKTSPALSKLGDNVYMEIKVTPETAGVLATNPNYTILVSSFFHEVGYPSFETRNRWDFYFNGSYFNKLSLIFCNKKLCEVYRHRKYFELP